MSPLITLDPFSFPLQSIRVSPEFVSPEASASRPLRVLFCCGGAYVSGAEIVTLSVMRGMQEMGHDVRCVATAWTDGDFPGRLEALGVPYRLIHLGMISKSLRPLHIKWTLHALFHLPGALRAFRDEVTTFQPDAIVVNSILVASLLRGSLDAQRCVFHAHDLATSTLHTRRALSNLGARAQFAAVSKCVAQSLVECDVAPERVHVVYNGIDLPDPLPAVPHHDADGYSRPVRVAILGQVAPWKGHEDLIDAIALLKAQGIAVHCVIAGKGDPDFMVALRNRIVGHALEGEIEWTGFLADVSSVYDRVDIVAVPTRTEEPFGLVAAEGGAYGLPVIASHRGGLPEVIREGHTGLLVDAERPDQLAEAIAGLAEDASRRRAMGAAAQRRVSELFSASRMVAGIEALTRRTVLLNEAFS